VVDALGRLLEVFRLRLRNRDEGLRIQVDQREPGALHLHHDAVAAAEGVVDVAEVVAERLDLARHEGSGFSKLLRNLPRSGLPRTSCWKPAVVAVGAPTSLPRLRALAGRILCRIDVDQLHHPVGIGAGGRDEQLRRHRAGDGHVLFQHLALVHQHVRAGGGEALVGHHVFLRHAGRRVADVGHRLGFGSDTYSSKPHRRPPAAASSACRPAPKYRVRALACTGGQAVVLAPDVGAGLEGVHLGDRAAGFTPFRCCSKKGNWSWVRK
jgi:hypothetical protein